MQTPASSSKACDASMRCPSSHCSGAAPLMGPGARMLPCVSGDGAASSVVPAPPDTMCACLCSLMRATAEHQGLPGGVEQLAFDYGSFLLLWMAERAGYREVRWCAASDGSVWLLQRPPWLLLHLCMRALRVEVCNRPFASARVQCTAMTARPASAVQQRSIKGRGPCHDTCASFSLT